MRLKAFRNEITPAEMNQSVTAFEQDIAKIAVAAIQSGGALASFSNLAGQNSFSDSGLSRNSTYYYRVRASNAAGNSGYSNTTSARTLKN